MTVSESRAGTDGGQDGEAEAQVREESDERGTHHDERESDERRAAATPEWQFVQMELKGQADTETKLGFGNSQWLYPHDGPQEELLQEPAYRSAKPVYYAAVHGDAEDNVYTLVIDESEGAGEGYDVVYVDADNDNRIDDTQERFEFRLGSTRHTEPLRIRLLVVAGGTKAPYHVNFSAFPYTDDNHPIEKIHANLRNSSYYGGEADLFGERRKIAISDLNSNGLFNDVEQELFEGDRFFVDLDGDGQIRSESNHQEAFPYGRYTRIASEWFSIVASPDGSRVEIARANPPLGKVEVPPRISDASLFSDTQPLYLEFLGGETRAVAGTYSVRSVRLIGSGTWGLPGRFSENRPTVTIPEGGTVSLVLGEPLTVEAAAVPKDEQGTLDFSLVITGIGGERYRWTQRRRDPPKTALQTVMDKLLGSGDGRPGFEIVDQDGKIIASEQFEYG